MNTTLTVLIRLVSSSINGIPAELPDESVDWGQVIKLASAHSLISLLCHSKKYSDVIPEKYLSYLKKKCIATSMLDASQEYEGERLLDMLDKNKIRAMPLKGYIIKKLYPSPELREMSDIDILVDAGFLNQLKTLMTSLGYTLSSEGENHDVYKNHTQVTVELHKNLVFPSLDLDIGRSDSWGRALKTEREYIYRLTPEDSYLYLIGHMVKHFYGMGCGIRFVLDIYVFDRYYSSLDRRYIESALEKCGLLTFARRVERLAEYWFGGADFDADTDALGEFIGEGCVYGSYKKYIAHNTILRDTGDSVPSGVTSVIFPSYKKMAVSYRWLNKVPFLLPVAWVMRIAKSIADSHGTLDLKKLRLAASIGNSEVLRQLELYKYLGLHAGDKHK